MLERVKNASEGRLYSQYAPPMCAQKSQNCVRCILLDQEKFVHVKNIQNFHAERTAVRLKIWPKTVVLVCLDSIEGNTKEI